MINISLACSNDSVAHVAVTIASVLFNANYDDNICFYILNNEVNNENIQKLNDLKSIKNCEINFINIPDENFVNSINNLHSILPNLDKVLYLDYGTIVNSSLKNLFTKKKEKFLVAGVLDYYKKNSINASVLLLNLKNIKEINNENILALINNVSESNTKLLEKDWNVQSNDFVVRSNYTSKPKIISFSAENKPWNYASFSYHKNLYFKYLQMTDWKLNKSDFRHWTFDNQIASSIKYFIYNPLFLLKPNFYKAFYKTYIQQFFEYKKPIIKNNTFIVWEPCSQSHSEVVPGYVKYLIDLGYHVSVIVNPQKYKEGLFSRFNSDKFSLNKMSRKQVKEFFHKNSLEDIEGVLVTTVGKLCDSVHYEQCYDTFNKNTDKSKLFFVEHEIVHSVDAGTWDENLITLRKLDYKNSKSVIVNPHYFGNVEITQKNKNITNFVTVGAIQGKRKNNDLIINAVKELHERGFHNFKITVIGKGHLKNLPKDIQKYFDIKGRLPFDKMYDELEKADFILTSYSKSNPKHLRYNTTGTSGTFQLVYGFLKPCVIIRNFAPINGFTDSNSILYDEDKNYADALQKGIEMSQKEYTDLQNNLKEYANNFYESSKQNLKNLIERKKGSIENE